MNELDRAIGVAERDPARFSVDSAEIERRKKWTASTRSQVVFISSYLHCIEVVDVLFILFSSHYICDHVCWI